MSFENLSLHPTLLKTLKHKGYLTPTPIQVQAIPEALAGHDLIATAETGTGKTAAFVLPALQHLIALPPKKQNGKPSVLILTPTRELAEQVNHAIRDYGKNLRVNSLILVGGMPYGPQLRSLSRPVDIIVATPGRLLDHVNRRRIDLSALKILVLDEADRMLDMGFIDEVEKIASLTPKERQTLLFTATWDNKMSQLAAKLLSDPQRIQLEPQNVRKNIEQRLHVVDNIEHKTRLLQHLVGNELITQAIIFSATKRGADEIAQQLTASGFPAAALHGDMSQAARNRTLNKLRYGRLRLLVATDVAARGIDISGVSHVINFDLPRFAEDYVHRIGRTGRAGATGTAISFALPDERIHLERIERYTGESVPRHVIPGFEPKHVFPTARKRKYQSSFTPTRHKAASHHKFGGQRHAYGRKKQQQTVK